MIHSFPQNPPLPKFLQRAISVLVGSISIAAAAPSSPVTDQVNWSSMLAEHDMLWAGLPKKWFEAPFLGNGEQGTMMYQLDKRTLRWDVGCSAAHDHRSFENEDLTEKNATTLNRGRHFIGHLRLELPADLSGGATRLSLWDAEAKGTLTSNGGSAEWTTLVHATEPVMRFDLTTKGQLKGAKFNYIAEEALNPRAVRAKTPRVPANPPPVLASHDGGVRTAVQNLHSGGQTAVAWLEKTVGDSTRLWLSVQHSFPGKEAEKQSIAAVRAAAAADPSAWLQSHRQWWHDYYPQSFVSVGDAYWDSFYWVQQYKLACATRDKGWIIDNQGPWLQPTAWCATWWNLNAQVSHSGGYTANRRSAVSAMSHRLDVNRDHLALNVAEPYRADSYAIGRSSSGWDLLGQAGQPKGRPPMEASIGRETGNLLWALHNVDTEYRYWQDQQLRDKVLYPLLTRAVNYYRHFLVKNDNGQFSLPETFSPEYRSATDCTYDIDLLHWGVGRLLELAAERNLTPAEEPLLPAWKEIQNKLVPAHIDEKSGRMIGRNVKLTGKHRHWSHLLAIYPLHTLTPDSPADRELIERSLNHWHSFGRAAGYSFTGGACMAALLGDGDRALDFLNGLKSFLHPNTLYSEIGLPVMETPLHGATAMQEMLLQSWGGRLRVFPGVATAWTDVRFHQLRGEGAFLVSASRQQGSTQWTLINAEHGGTVEVDPRIADAQWTSSPGVQVKTLRPGIHQIVTQPGDWVLFWPKNKPKPSTTVSPVTRRGNPHHFGMPGKN